MDRAAWLEERRRIGVERMDTLWAPGYDEHWGAISATHRRMMQRFLAACPRQARVLDAACGTGKYWPLLLEEGCSIAGVDHSEGMLRQARAKFPAVQVARGGVQELSFEDAFDGVLCVDAMESMFPEDWPIVLGHFHRALRREGVLYFTVELAEPDLPAVNRAAKEAGLPVVDGEYINKSGGYHYYPGADRARAWAEAACFAILEEASDDTYQHFLARKR